MRPMKVTKRIYQASELFTSTLDCPEQRLFAAVLSQAVHDATCGHVSKIEKESAEAFLLSRSEHFKIICELAGWVPEYVYDRARRYFQKQRMLRDNGWNVDVSMKKKRKSKYKGLTGNAYYAEKRKMLEANKLY